MRRLLLSSIIAIAMAAPATGQVLVSSGPPTNGITPLGKDVVSGEIPTAIAQTFMQPTGFNYLQSVTFYLSSGFGGGSDLLLTGSIYRFDTDHLVGSALFSTPFFPATDLTDPTPMTFGDAEHPLNLFLPPGETYALVLSSIEAWAGLPDLATTTFGDVEDIYPGGALFFSTITDPAHINDVGAFIDAGSVFGTGAGSLDAAGAAVFTSTAVVATPEPPTFALFTSGLIGLIGLVRRRVAGERSRLTFRRLDG